MISASVANVRLDLADLLNKVIYQEERVVITRHGKPVAAIVPLHTMEILDKLRLVLEEDKMLHRLENLRPEDLLTEEEVKKALGL